MNTMSPTLNSLWNSAFVVVLGYAPVALKQTFMNVSPPLLDASLGAVIGQ
jgi:hypothetical protein